MAGAEVLRPIGIHAARLKNSQDFREKAFVEQWQYDETGTLELLMQLPVQRTYPGNGGRDSGTYYERPLGPTTERDRIVAETLMQWLGSNCGMSFLQSALRRVGGDIKWPPRPGAKLPEKDCLEKPVVTPTEQPPRSDACYDLINAVLYLQSGACPNCGHLATGPMTTANNRSQLACFSCGFHITRSEAIAIMHETAQTRKLSVTALEKWRASRDIKPPVEHAPPQPATVTTDMDKVLSLLQELGCGSHISTSGNAKYVAATSPSKQGQPGVVFEFDRVDLSFVGVFGEAM